MKIFKKIVMIMMSCGIGLILCACGKQNENKLVMGTSGDYPPFEFWKNGELVGVEIELAQAIVKKMGYELEIKDMNFDGIIAALNSKTVDFAMSALTITDERKKFVDFSSEYYMPKFSILYKKVQKIENSDQLIGKKVGVQLGSTMEMFVKEKSKKLGDITIISLSRLGELVQELKIGRIDVVVIEESETEHYIKANEELAHTVLKDDAGKGYAVAFPKNSQIRDLFEKALLEMKMNGELNEILKKWSL